MRNAIQKTATILLGSLCLWLLTSGVALAQCAMCAATVEANSKENGAGLAEGLNTGILYLMTIPYVLFSVVGFIWYRSAQKRKLAAKGTRH